MIPLQGHARDGAGAKRIAQTFGMSILALVIVLAAVWATPRVAYAAQAEVTLSTHEVNLQAGEQDFEVSFTVSQQSAFAGAEFGVQSGVGVEISSVTYSVPKGSVGPVAADGLSWFSFFSGKNEFTQPVTATLHLRYAGVENTRLVLDNVQVYTKTATSVTSEYLNLRETISIYRAGATGDPAPLDPPSYPEQGSNGTGDGQNTGSGAGTGTGTGGSATTGVTYPALSALPTAASNSASSNATSATGTPSNATADATASSLSELAEEATPRATLQGVGETGDTSEQAGLLNSPLFWVAGACIAAAAALVLVLLKRRRSDEAKQKATSLPSSTSED